MNRGELARLVSFITGVFLFVYVASTGPVVAYAEKRWDMDNDSKLAESLTLAYYPLIKLSMACRPVGDVLTWYVEQCRRGVKDKPSPGSLPP